MEVTSHGPAHTADSSALAVDARSALPPHLRYDVIVIGAGVAGLAFTLSLPPRLRVALLTKGMLGESNTRTPRLVSPRPSDRTTIQGCMPRTRWPRERV